MKMRLYFTLVSVFISCFWLVGIQTFTLSADVIPQDETNDIKQETNEIKQKTNDVNFAINSSCQCVDFNCGCCAFINIEKIGLNNTVCINLTYLPKEVGISFTVSIGNRTVYNETISARSPPPICFGVPYLKEMAELCIKFYDLDASFHKLHGCVQLEARLGHIEVGEYKLGCFDIGKITGNLDQHHSANQIEVLVI